MTYGKISAYWIWATAWENQQNAPREDSDQSGLRPVWSESALYAQWIAKGPRFLHADSEDWSDWADAQIDLSLRWAHTYFVDFIMSWLICLLELEAVLSKEAKSLFVSFLSKTEQ